LTDPINLTRQLVRIESTTGSEGPVAEFLATLLERAGWTVVRQPVSPGRFNVYAHQGTTPAVVLSTHLDTVPPYIPLSEDDDSLHGRGTCDAKGLAAAMIAAAEELRSTGERRLGLLFIVGEENGSDGAMAAATLEPRGRWLINGEPTENVLSIGQKGVLRADLTATGRAAHSGYPELGSSAVDALLDTIVRIRTISLPEHPLLGPATLNIGQIEGGVAPNVIPPAAHARLLFRTVASTGGLRAAIEQALAPGVTVSFPLEIPFHLSEAPEGWDSGVVAFTSDLPFLHGPWGTGFQMGPGSIRVAHTDREHIRKADLLGGVERYAQLARDLLARSPA
jgi:acetylornithine deacetylase